MWINKFKIALVSKDTAQLKKLLDEIPKFSDKADAVEISCLLKEAVELFNTLKNETSSSMKQIKKNIDFLKSTHIQSSSKLDIKS